MAISTSAEVDSGLCPENLRAFKKALPKLPSISQLKLKISALTLVISIKFFEGFGELFAKSFPSRSLRSPYPCLISLIISETRASSMGSEEICSSIELMFE